MYLEKKTELPTLAAALERSDRFKAELKTCDVAMKAQLIGAWKEMVMEYLVELFRVTDDPDAIAFVDINIAAGLEVPGYRKKEVIHGAPNQQKALRGGRH